MGICLYFPEVYNLSFKFLNHITSMYHMYIHLYMYIYSVFRFINVSICLLFTYLSIYSCTYLLIHIFIYLFIYLCNFLFIHLIIPFSSLRVDDLSCHGGAVLRC